MILSVFFLAVATATGVSAHGYFPLLKIGSDFIPGWVIAKPLRVVLRDSGYVVNVTSRDIAFSIGNSHLAAGRYGPVLNYMAKCDADDSSTFKGDTGSPRFKLSPSVFENAEWVLDTLAKNDYTYDVTIPKNIKSGRYLLGHENLTLDGYGPWHLFNSYLGDASKEAHILPGGDAYPGWD
ncbi:uncharacterized protein BT62DRAFT_987445 [Guyanagaster necrorhizus]|uniref:lytic cellulose monooxygenase (C4-dehydrogenating) n=1 Tax=Guyanagaster necrorhizus TaxID=856835 RepID=A0A9P7VRC5_9AGAR|nr:uncharacterized protein BT62DRAFT_987445 [Guyanagaster necrorhizus MCA 3950]KAG7445253.1 hypothetical protein BT62DRAFT_987445 [Guyanagaster necrorhizus MCA 3950]